MGPPKFGDFSKSVDDLLNNDYCFDRKVKVKTKTANGYEITSEGVMKGGNTVTGKVTAKIPFSNGITLNKLGVTHDGRFIADASYSNVIKGLSLSTLVEDGGKKPSVGEIGATYKHAMFTAKLKVDAMNGPTIKDSVSVQHKNFVAGAEVKYNTGLDGKASSAGLKDYSAGLSYVEKDVVVALKALKKLTEYEVSVHHKVHSGLQVGAVYKAGKSQSLSFGSLYKVDSLTSVQTKADSTGLVSVNFIQKVSDNLKMIVSSSVDATNLAADTHKFGLQLHLS